MIAAQGPQAQIREEDLGELQFIGTHHYNPRHAG